jgi:hypothetical protein
VAYFKLPWSFLEGLCLLTTAGKYYLLASLQGPEGKKVGCLYQEFKEKYSSPVMPQRLPFYPKIKNRNMVTTQVGQK